MHSGGYLDRSVNHPNPTRLGVIVALHGVALAALMLAPAEMTVNPDWTLELYPVKADPPPPDVAPEPPQKNVRKEAVDQTEPLVPTATGGSTPTFTNYPDDDGTVTLPTTPITTPVRFEAVFVQGVEIQPNYPPALARQDIEGVVTVRVLIGTDGRVKEVQQVSATDPEFFRATQRQALRHWRFKPATSDGMAVESWRQMTVRFKLEA